LPPDYVAQHVELAYATTAYGAQGTTVASAHVLVGDHTGAASAYVGMTRGRDHNTAHLVAPSLEEARRQWIEVFGRDRADLGPTHAAQRATDDIERYGPNAPHDPRRRRLLSPAEIEQRRVEHIRQSPTVPAYSPPSRTRSPGIGF
jgi:exodeoxyribonuclease V alpha subunit